MIARFLNESSVLRTDTKDLFNLLKDWTDTYEYEDSLVLSDGKPSPWFTGIYKGKDFLCFAYDVKVYGTETSKNFILIFKKAPKAGAKCTTEVQRGFGLPIPFSEEKGLKVSAQYVRNFMKMLSKMDDVDSMARKVVKNEKNLAHHDWTDGKMVNIL